MDKDSKLAKASGSLDSDSSPVSKTLNQLYKSHSSLTYAFWNDEHSDGKKINSPYAHAKGIVAFDGKSGFWITHSLPKFPGTTKQGNPSYDGAATTYGQHFFCITIDKAALSNLNELAMVNRYSVYDAADNANVGSDFTDWALDKKYGTETSKVISVKSKGGQSFTAFAKMNKFDNALYEELVASEFKTNLYTETWQNGVGKMPSWCGGGTHKYAVENIKTVNFPGKTWTESQDHSKWAIAEKLTSSKGIFCVGDINRQTGQYNRGGGTICINDLSLAKQVEAVIGDTEKCKKQEDLLVV
jgi:deoxyribonuclease-2